MSRVCIEPIDRETLEFALAHRDEDTARLLLGAARYPAVDMPAAVQQIEGLRTAREKWPSLCACPACLYPPRLNREQASSEATARYKASLAGGKVADLTGGMGIDSLAFARVASHVDYVERDPHLCALMEHNCRALGPGNVSVHCADSLEWLSQQQDYDLLYIDPARRGAAGRKVAAFEDCQPDILQHLPLLRTKGKRLLVKASPMIDLHRAVEQLGTVAAVHVVALHGECKEALFLCQGDPVDEPLVHCVNIAADGIGDFTFRRSDEAAAVVPCCTAVERYLYEPHAALMKAGPFRLIGQRYGVQPLAPSTRLYTSDSRVPEFPGRVFEVLQEVALNRKAIRQVLPGGKAHVAVRNFPVEAAALQRQLGLREGGDLFVIATTLATRRLGLLCRPAQ